MFALFFAIATARTSRVTSELLFLIVVSACALSRISDGKTRWNSTSCSPKELSSLSLRCCNAFKRHWKTIFIIKIAIESATLYTRVRTGNIFFKSMFEERLWHEHVCEVCSPLARLLCSPYRPLAASTGKPWRSPGDPLRLLMAPGGPLAAQW